MRQHRIVTAAMILVLTLAAASAQAELITITFGGTLDTVEDPNNVLDSSVFVGAPFSGTFSYDPTGAVGTGGPDWADYGFDNPFAAQIGDMLFTAPRFGISVSNRVTQDGYGFGKSFFSSSGLDDLLMWVTLLDYSATAIDTLDLPISPIDLSRFSDEHRFKLMENVGGINVRGDLAFLTVVPEPSAILFALVAYLPAFSHRRSFLRPASKS